MKFLCFETDKPFFTSGNSWSKFFFATGLILHSRMNTAQWFWGNQVLQRIF